MVEDLRGSTGESETLVEQPLCNGSVSCLLSEICNANTSPVKGGVSRFNEVRVVVKYGGGSNDMQEDSGSVLFITIKRNKVLQRIVYWNLNFEGKYELVKKRFFLKRIMFQSSDLCAFRCNRESNQNCDIYFVTVL